MQENKPTNGNGQAKPEPATNRVENPFGTQQAVALAGSASAQALTQREIAEVQAALVVARKFPRDPVIAMDRILNACTRPGLAAKASYEYAKGGQDVSGASIRMAEVLAQNWGNIATGVIELSRSMDSRGVGVSECLTYAWDLETNFRDEKRFQVRHYRDTKQGGYPIKEEREIYELIANNGARRKRACILAVIPGDVQEAAERQCEVTLATKVKVTPELVQSLVDKFAPLGITKEMLEKRIQKRMDAITPGAVINLGKIYNSIKDGMSTAAEWFEMAAVPAGQQPGEPGAKETAKSKMDAMAAETDTKPAGEAAKAAASKEQEQPKSAAETTVKTTKAPGKTSGKKAADKPSPAAEPEDDSLFGDKT